MNKMNSPFENDPFALVYQAFKNLYPDKNCSIWWKPNLKDDTGKIVFGITTFLPDGEIIVTINPDINVSDAIEVLAHELAHVVAGVENEHGPEWKTAFNAIGVEYEHIGQKNFDFYEEFEDE